MNTKVKHTLHTLRMAALVCLAALLAACSDDNEGPAPLRIETQQVNVDVVLPAAVRESWQPAIDMALQQIAKAQQMQSRQVKLNLRYHDEDSEDLDQLAYRLTHPEEGDDTCHAILGPYHSSHARTFLNYAAASRLPVLMPTCTGGELQRVEARSTNAWFFTESDITQAEVLMSFSRINASGQVALIYSDDAYGRTFYEWLGYYATEYRMPMAREPYFCYHEGDDVTAFAEALRADTVNTFLVLALSSEEDYLKVLPAIRPGVDLNRLNCLTAVCTDVGMSRNVLALDEEFLALAPVAQPSTGWAAVYEQVAGHEAYTGEAQVYDALCVLALGAARRMWADDPQTLYIDGKRVEYSNRPYGPTLTDWMRAAVADEEGEASEWKASGLSAAFSAYSRQQHCNLQGALGGLEFDATSRTKLLHTCYALVKRDAKGVSLMGYLSTAEDGGVASTKPMWEWDKVFEQDFDPSLIVNHHLPACTDRWAVVISPSTTWANYRHQADAFAMYQLLRQGGYDDDHIVLICEDNLAYSDYNKAHPGSIYVMTGEDDVRAGAKVDYRFSDLTREDFCDILLGRQSDRLPQVIHSTATSNVFLFWSGHGGNGEGPLWGDESAHYAFGTERIAATVRQMSEEDRFRRMMLSIETCFSGTWGEALTGIPDVVILTAANAYEPSKADVHDAELGVFLSNAYARAFRDAVRGNSSITLHDLYTRLARSTTGSHVSLYNDREYGSVYDMDMSDYFGK